MNAELKTAWLTMLREPTTLHGDTLLRSLDDKMTALGVLLEVAKIPSIRGESYYVYRYEGTSSVMRLSDKLIHSLRLRNKQIRDLENISGMNITFQEAIKYIEDNV